MSFFDAIVLGLRNYASFSGRATRAEYWYWIVPVVIINVVLGVIDQALNPGSQMGALSWLTMIVFFASILPTLGVSIRRLHDIDRSGQSVPAVVHIGWRLGADLLGMPTGYGRTQ